METMRTTFPQKCPTVEQTSQKQASNSDQLVWTTYAVSWYEVVMQGIPAGRSGVQIVTDRISWKDRNVNNNIFLWL